MSLTNLSVRLDGLGRRKDALAAIREAADTYRQLAAAVRTRSGPAWPPR